MLCDLPVTRRFSPLAGAERATMSEASSSPNKTATWSTSFFCAITPMSCANCCRGSRQPQIPIFLAWFGCIKVTFQQIVSRPHASKPEMDALAASLLPSEVGNSFGGTTKSEHFVGVLCFARALNRAIPRSTLRGAPSSADRPTPAALALKGHAGAFGRGRLRLLNRIEGWCSSGSGSSPTDQTWDHASFQASGFDETYAVVVRPPRRSRTAKASRISRHAVKWRCAREWGGWGRLSDDGPGQNNPDPSEGPWGRWSIPPHGGAFRVLRPDTERTTVATTRCTKGEANWIGGRRMPGAGLSRRSPRKAPLEKPAFQPYRKTRRTE